MTKTVLVRRGNHISHIKSDTPSVVTFKASAPPMSPGMGEAAAKPAAHKADDLSTEKWVPWGDNDRWPFDFIEKLDKIGVALTGVDINADMHYGAGIHWFVEEITEDAKIIKRPIHVPEWEDFINNSDFELAHSDAIQSLETFYIAFVEVILNKGKNKIHNIQCLDTPYCRFETPKNGSKSNKVYFVRDIDEGGEDYDTINIFDPQDPFKHAKFVVPLKYRTFGQPFYTTPNVYATFLNGWADVAIDVPKIIKAIYKNSASLKYHIIIPISALKAEYSNYDEMSPEDQIRVQEDKKTAIDEAITTAEKSGISVMSVYNDLDDLEHITIEPIKSFLDATKDLPNAHAANSEILFSLGTDPSLVGSGMPGGKNLSGSGSDKRESRENKQKNIKRDRIVSLQLLKVLKHFFPTIPENAFPLYIDADNSQTLDKNPTGSQNTVN